MVTDNDILEISPPISKNWRIYRFLCEHLTYGQIQKKTNYNYKYISKIAKKYVRNGKLIQISKYPAIFAKNKDIATHIYRVGDIATEKPLENTPLIIPHKLGISFLLFGIVPLPSFRGHKIIKELDHTVIFRKYKAVIWLRNSHGLNIEEILKNAELMAKGIAIHYEKRFGISLQYEKIYSGIEWVIPDKNRAKQIADHAGIKEYTRRKVGRAIHKYKDSSHDSFEIEVAPKEPQEEPTSQAKMHEYLYAGGLARDLIAIKESIQEIKYRFEIEKKV